MQQLLGTATGASLTLREIEMRDSFYQRAVKPVFTTLLQKLGRLAPQRNIEELHQKLDRAGLLASLNVVDFLGLKILCGIFFGLATAAVIYLAKFGSPIIMVGALGLFGLLGFTLPNSASSA
jgi:hypothetical protein